MINVCFFSGDITRSGGTERVSTVIANELQKDQELNISFLSLWENHRAPFYNIDKNIKRDALYKKEATGIHHFFGYIWRTRRFIKKRKIDILIDIDGILDMYSIPAVKGLKTKVISWEQFNYYQHPYVNYRKRTRRLAAKHADAIVVITREDKGYYEQNLNIKNRIEQIYNPMTIKNDNSSYDIDSKTILSVGRLSEQKGFDMLVDAAKSVFDKHPDWHWIIIGDGEQKEKLENKIKDYSLQRNISIISNVKNIEDYYKKSAMYVMTSRYEGFGLVLTEAQAFYLPCVSFKCPAGPSEIINNQVNGFLIECFNLDKMTERINQLIEDNELRMSFSKKTSENLNKFDLKIVCNQWSNLLKGL